MEDEMARPNPLRSIGGEKALAARIASEREQRGMTYEGLASRMTAIGCPIQASAIFKIEKSNPPRHITVDELVALGRVFKLELEDLVQPPALAKNKQLRRLVETVAETAAETLRVDEEHKAALRALGKFAAAYPAVVAELESGSNFRLADILDVLNQVAVETNAETGARQKRISARENKRKAES
jgi:transcriptional regulator with XRE-family HTH domain